jgi:hypothetical protein
MRQTTKSFVYRVKDNNESQNANMIISVLNSIILFYIY